MKSVKVAVATAAMALVALTGCVSQDDVDRSYGPLNPITISEDGDIEAPHKGMAEGAQVRVAKGNAVGGFEKGRAWSEAEQRVVLYSAGMGKGFGVVVEVEDGEDSILKALNEQVSTKSLSAVGAKSLGSGKSGKAVAEVGFGSKGSTEGVVSAKGFAEGGVEGKLVKLVGPKLGRLAAELNV